jgi:hypothetical protein
MSFPVQVSHYSSREFRYGFKAECAKNV